MERLRLVENPVDRLARSVEALLVIASKPLSIAELASVTEEEEERVETALGLVAGRFREGRSGVVLEHVAGGYAFRAAREAAAMTDTVLRTEPEPGIALVTLDRPDRLNAMSTELVADLHEVLGEIADDVFGEHRVTVVDALPDALDTAAGMADAGGGVSGGVLATGSVVTAAEVRMLLGTTDV